jgi:site-specific recombinase XerC
LVRFPAGQQLGHQVSSTINEGNRMPAKRELTMRQVRQMLRLHRDGVNAREIRRTLGVARGMVQEILRRATAAGLP